MSLNENQQPRPSGARFATTHWSMVLAAGDRADLHYEDALQSLCQTYWYPLYAYVRQRGHPAQDAEDLTQAFFARLLEKDYLAQVTQDKGRFRSFLLSALNHFRIDAWKRSHAQRRGGGRTHLTLDRDQAEARYNAEPVDRRTPETLFEHNWAVTLLNTVFERLQEEQEKAGKAETFEQLKFCLTGARSEVPYAELAETLSLSDAALKVQVYRLRKRYRELLRQEVAHTLSDPAEVEEELRYLFQVLSA